MYCTFEKCEAPPAPQLNGIPVCIGHAKKVYLAVSDLMGNATFAQRSQAARKGGVAGRPRLLNSDRPGVVYFARFGYLIKIGFSTNLDARMAELHPDEVLATLPGTMRDEKALHARFKRLRERDEYFLPGPELTDYIATLAREAM